MKKLSFEDFQNEVKNRILQYIPMEIPNRNVEVILEECHKINGEKVIGLSIRNSLYNVIPRIYLNGYYQEYSMGHTMEYCLTSMGYDYHQAMKMSPAVRQEDLLIYDAVSNSLEVQLLNTDVNREWLQNYPHKEIEDLSLIYSVRINETSQVKINYELMNIYGMGLSSKVCKLIYSCSFLSFAL